VSADTIIPMFRRRGHTRGVDPRPGVTLYSRRTCGLCDEARAVILAERRRGDFPFDEVFIDEDDDLERDFGLRVPVVLVAGVERFEYHVDPARFRALVAPS
jgi:Glutaredoxin-like domain (DUF836)